MGKRKKEDPQISQEINVENSQNISIDQKIVNYFSSVPKWGFVVFLTSTFLVLFAVGFLVWKQSPVSPMGGNLNIAVLPFVEKHLWGYSESDLGTTIAQIISEDLKNATDESMTVWGPSDKVPNVWGIKEESLELSAQKKSEQLNAHIVIYGVISEDKYGDPLISVRFYISPQNFGDAQELIGSSLLGDLSIGSFRLSGDTVSGTDLLSQNEELRDRILIFSNTIKGLGAYIGQDFELANTYFGEALEPDLWKNPSGKEVLYLLLGNMSIRETRVLLDDMDKEGAYEVAQQGEYFFQKALNVSIESGKGSYARAYLGLAGLENMYAMADARLQNDTRLINKESLERMDEYLIKALEAKYQPATADITEKVAYSRGQINLAYFLLTGDEEYLDVAYNNYVSVTQAYKKGNSRLTEFAALSFTGIANIENLQGYPEEAIESYLHGFEITHSSALKAQILINVGQIYDQQGDFENALTYYQDGIKRKQDLQKVMSNSSIAMVEQRIEEIKSELLK